MKRTFLSIAAACCMIASASAQEAFKHLSLGVDLSTTGVGVSVAMPIVTDHIVLAAGYNFMTSLSNMSMSESISVDDINNTISQANSKLAQIPGETTRLNPLSPAKLTIAPALNLGTGKVVLEFYPSKKSSFHFTAGAYFGASQVVTVDALISDTFWNEYSQLASEVSALNAKYKDNPAYGKPIDMPTSMKYNVDGKTLEVNTTNKRNINIGFDAMSVRPYLGLGFGRSIPNSHLGFQFDLGAWYHGKLNLSSKNEVAFDPTAENMNIDAKTMSLVEKLSIYPSVSLRLIYRIF